MSAFSDRPTDSEAPFTFFPGYDMLYDPVQKKTDQARRLEAHRLQSEILILQQDERKKRRKMEAATLELRRLRNEANRLKIETEARTAEEASLKRELGFLEADIRRLTKKLNLMS